MESIKFELPLSPEISKLIGRERRRLSFENDRDFTDDETAKILFQEFIKEKSKTPGGAKSSGKSYGEPKIKASDYRDLWDKNPEGEKPYTGRGPIPEWLKNMITAAN
jgi:hypothetical protein